jgi:hypothetical protein
MIDWARLGQWAAVIGYALFFVWMTRKAIRREIEREAEGDLFI